jgi:hypothetical protein
MSRNEEAYHRECVEAEHLIRSEIPQTELQGSWSADEVDELRQAFDRAYHQSRLAPDAPAAKFIVSGLLTASGAVSATRNACYAVSNPSNYSCEVADRPQGTLTEVELDLVAVEYEVFRPSRRGIDTV